MKFSVIIPVFNQWNLVPRLLDCLAVQTIGLQAFEVILVDNGSYGFVKPEFEYPGMLEIVVCAKPGSYAARNMGLRHATGQWLAFTDADCLPTPGWLESFGKFNATSNLLIAGRVDVCQGSSSPGPYEIYDLIKGIPQDVYVERGYAATANLFVPFALIKKLAGFREDLYSGADKEFCLRANAVGAELFYLDQAKVFHRARLDWGDLATKARRLKGGQYYSSSGHKRCLVVLRTFMPPVFAIGKFVREDTYSLGDRLKAIFVQFRLWGVEMREIIRLTLQGRPERR